MSAALLQQAASVLALARLLSKHLAAQLVMPFSYSSILKLENIISTGTLKVLLVFPHTFGSRPTIILSLNARASCTCPEPV